MIEVERLTRRYGTVKAVDGVSFTIGRGEIVGLLGLNGAGKTTTMRMLTTFLQPTSGRAALAGHDVLDEPLEVRRKVGYLPESVPLYNEMRVREYLSFRARLKDVPRGRRRAAIQEVIGRCQLGKVEDRILGQLSKGFRQRVGLAEALLHAPEILILDEPTAGLDPVQVREVRALIRELGDGHTILLSTHIMPEVEAVCSRVIIIERGRIAVDDTLERLASDRAIVVEVRGPADEIRSALAAIPGVGQVSLTRADDVHATFEVQTHGDEDLREQLAARVIANQWSLRKLDLRRATLEVRFIQAVSRQAVAVVDPGIPADGEGRGTAAASEPIAREAV
jgi:ABC-2 type transport system ATP-binding protein